MPVGSAESPALKAVLLDMDGVLFHGERALPDAAEFMRFIAPMPHGFVTNNPVSTPQRLAEKLRRLGLGFPDPDRIVTSAEATAEWLSREKPGFRYFAVGGEGLHAALAKVGSEDSERADYVVIGEGRGLDYDSLTTGINLVLGRGAGLVSTNPDVTVDSVVNGRRIVLPGGGALAAPFSVATGVEPVVIGKPEPALFRMALARLGVEPGDCVMVGDRPDTDILGAQRLGMRTALVRTGRFAPSDPLPAGVAPDWDVDSLGELMACWSKGDEIPGAFRE